MSDLGCLSTCTVASYLTKSDEHYVLIVSHANRVSEQCGMKDEYFSANSRGRQFKFCLAGQTNMCDQVACYRVLQVYIHAKPHKLRDE